MHDHIRALLFSTICHPVTVPRRKLYHTKQEKKAANSAKCKQYYARYIYRGKKDFCLLKHLGASLEIRTLSLLPWLRSVRQRKKKNRSTSTSFVSVHNVLTVVLRQKEKEIAEKQCASAGARYNLHFIQISL